MSIGAVMVSIFGYVQSREAGRLAKIASEASVQVTHLRLVEPYHPGEQIKADVELVNFGKIPAKDVYITLTAVVGIDATLLARARYVDREGHFVTFGELPPGATRIVRHNTDTLPAESRDEILSRKLSLMLYGLVRYHDVTGKQGREVYAFCLSPTTADDFAANDLARCQYEPDMGPVSRAQSH